MSFVRLFVVVVIVFLRFCDGDFVSVLIYIIVRVFRRAFLKGVIFINFN